MSDKPMLTEMPIRIKAYEIDAVGIVSNIVYIKWFEDMRHAFLDKYYPYQEMMRSNVSPVLVKTVAEYKKPLTITDNPVGRSWVSKMGAATWEITLQIASENGFHCIGKQRGGFFDVESKQLTRTPDRLIAAYRAERGQ